jgi:hypothetical protein
VAVRAFMTEAERAARAIMASVALSLGLDVIPDLARGIGISS